MHVALHKIRRLSLLNYVYVWVQQPFFFQRVGFKGIWYLKMWVGVSRCSGFWNEYRGLYWIFFIQPLSAVAQSDLFDSTLNSTFPCFYFAQETTILQLQAPQLEFLLDDLSRKLQYSLSASASSRRSFLKVSISILSTRDLMKDGKH